MLRESKELAGRVRFSSELIDERKEAIRVSREVVMEMRGTPACGASAACLDLVEPAVGFSAVVTPMYDWR
jgi:hypothetical protein